MSGDPVADLRFDWGDAPSTSDPFSLAAARSVRHAKASQRRRLYLLVAGAPDGLTCDQLEERTGGLHQSVSAALNELETRGFLVRFGQRRTRSNRWAGVYHPAPDR